MNGESSSKLVVDQPTYMRLHMTKKELAEALWYFANKAFPAENPASVLDRIGQWRVMHGADSKRGK